MEASKEIAVKSIDHAAVGAKNGGEDVAQVVFIDKFLVPGEARETFYQRVRDNRSFIRTLPGFMGDEAFESRDEHGGWVFMTIARWADSAALGRAKERVLEENKRKGFDPAAFMQSLGVRMERGVFTPVKEVR